MQRNYSFNINNNEYTSLYSPEASKQIADYKLTIKIAIRLIATLLNSTNFYIDLIASKASSEGREISFVVKSNKKEAKLKIICSYITYDDYIEIEYENNKYKYNVNWDAERYYASLVEFEEKNADISIKEIFKRPNLNLEIIKENRCYSFEIPYSINYTLDTSFFKTIKKDSDLKELKELYIARFYNGQTDYEKKIDTTISIYEKLEGRSILINRIILNYGKISSFYIAKHINGCLLAVAGTSTEDLEVKIENYNPRIEIDLNSEIESLYNQVLDTLDKGIILKL